MTRYVGKGVYGAVAIGRVSIFKKNDAAVSRVRVEDTAAEIARVDAAKAAALARSARRNIHPTSPRSPVC